MDSKVHRPSWAVWKDQRIPFQRPAVLLSRPWPCQQRGALDKSLHGWGSSGGEWFCLGVAGVFFFGKFFKGFWSEEGVHRVFQRVFKGSSKGSSKGCSERSSNRKGFLKGFPKFFLSSLCLGRGWHATFLGCFFHRPWKSGMMFGTFWWQAQRHCSIPQQVAAGCGKYKDKCHWSQIYTKLQQELFEKVNMRFPLVLSPNPTVEDPSLETLMKPLRLDRVDTLSSYKGFANGEAGCALSWLSVAHGAPPKVSEQACAMLRDGILSSSSSERRCCLVREATDRNLTAADCFLTCGLGLIC